MKHQHSASSHASNYRDPGGRTRKLLAWLFQSKAPQPRQDLQDLRTISRELS